MRLAGKTAAIIGAGQTAGATIGNGRATALLFARQGAKVLAVDRDLASAEETVAQIVADGGEAVAWQADVLEEATMKKAVEAVVERWGRLDILHNNVGIGTGDAPVHHVDSDTFDHIQAVNLRGMIYACKYAIPMMRAQGGGAIVNVSSMAAWAAYPLVAYKTSKAAVIALTQQIAWQNAKHQIRANVILPGLIETPMAVEGRSRATGRSREEIAAERHARVPMGHMGTAWDVAYAALYLASDEAKFVTGVALPVDGGTSVSRG